MASTNIEKAFRKIEKDFVKIAKEAAKDAAEMAQKDIRQKADEFIDEYYAEYQPEVYKRKYALYKLVEGVYKERENAKGLTIEFGVLYNASNISGVHESNSWYRQSGTRWIPRLSSDFDFDSSNNGIPEAPWIMDKFIHGIHPSGYIGESGGVKFKSPDAKMQSFFDKQLNKRIKSYMNDALMRAVEKYF